MSRPTIPLRRLFDVVNGGTPTSDPENWGGDVPWATPADLSEVSGPLHTTRRTLTRSGAHSGSAIVPSESILVSTRAPIGYTALAGAPMAFNQGCRALVPKKEIDERFFRYQLEASQEELQARGLGTTFLELSSGALASVPIEVPDIEEQRRIANFLDGEIGRIDRLIEARRRQIDLISQRYSVAISECLTPGITKVKKRNPVWPWLPGNLDMVRLGYFSHIQGGVTVDASRLSTSEDDDFPYLRVANVQGEEIDLSEVKTIRIPVSLARRSMLTEGDVVMTEANGNPENLGRGAVWRGTIPDMVHQNHIFAIKLDKDRFSPKFISFLLASVHGRRYFHFTSNQVGIATTSARKVLEMPVPNISINQQAERVAECNNIQESSRRVSNSLNRQISLLSERRQALITAAVTSQIDVTTARGVDEAYSEKLI